ncbi:hybrid sensor histidine kinase/response regulator [Ramlibacter sp. MMS24-I3-19]|uniref:hybrid sensor histidine kinase/response regulator n=1 Tax=Ramlibacter sp. MMS24-I3-19 TaxID=3416606 RepID=UPI003D0208D9
MRLPPWVTLDRWLVGGALLVLVLVAALVLNVVNTRSQQQIARLVSHTNELLDAISETRTDILLLASADQTFLLTNTDDDMRRLVPLTRQAAESGRRIVELGRGDLRQEARIPQVLARLQMLSEYYVSAVDGEGANANLAVRYRLLSGYGPRLIESLNRQLIDMDEIGRDLLADRAAASERAYRTALATGVATGLSSILLVICFVALMRRHMRKRLRDAAMLRRLSDELREADRRKDQFLATLAHELRNPLAPIRTAASIIAAPQLDRTKLAWCRDVIGRQVAHMAFLLDDLLDISRITQGKLTLRREPVSLASVIDVAVEAARPLIERKLHFLAVDIERPVPIVNVDPLRLSQALTNLLTNAAKYTDPQGRILLRASHAGSSLVLRVCDNGVGIAPELLDRVFGMFTQVDAQHRRSEGGLGIGLALTRGLVELHGGTVSAHSHGPGTGTEFSITLPDAVVGEAEPASDKEQGVASPVAAASSHYRILVADANRDAADALGILLEMAGHEVCIAASAQDALQCVARDAPDIAFLDTDLSDLDSHALAREMRATPQGRAMALVEISEPAQSGDEQEAMRAGFDLRLTKPVDPDALEALLKRPLSQLTARREAAAGAEEGPEPAAQDGQDEVPAAGPLGTA